MEKKPDTTVHAIERAKPRLLICDDDPVLLVRFAAQYRARGYDVIPVMVSSGFEDRLMQDGRMKQGEDVAPLNAFEEPTHKDPVSTVASELAHARDVAKYNSGEEYAARVTRFEAMQQITYGVVSKTQLRALMQEVKPDFVLSDREMRRPADPDIPAQEQAEDDDVLLGEHVMAMAAAVFPSAPRAIHTGKYTVQPELRAQLDGDSLAKWRARFASDCAKANAALGDAPAYRIFPKDEADTHTTCAAVDAYFRPDAGRARG
jgi:hypothetical protein